MDERKEVWGMDSENRPAHKLENCGREMAYTEKELVKVIVGAAFSQFVQTATHDSGEASHA